MESFNVNRNGGDDLKFEIVMISAIQTGHRVTNIVAFIKIVDTHFITQYTFVIVI